VLSTNNKISAQAFPGELLIAIKMDDTTKLSEMITPANVNDCDGMYSILSQAVRVGAYKCTQYLTNHGANVNLVCDGYVPPLMHAAKYGRLEIAKWLVAKGADLHYTYHGPSASIEGMTPLTYAEKFKQTEVADFLRTAKTK
jgi:ankyrin repeat protein